MVLSRAFEKYQQQLKTILDARPVNLTNEVRPLTMQCFTKVKPTPVLLRQRALVMILLANELNSVPEYKSYINAIIKEIFFCVKAFLDTQDDEYKNSLASIDFTSKTMADDSVPMMIHVRLRTDEIAAAVKALYKLTDENCDMAIVFKRVLEGMIKSDPDKVCEWIKCFKFVDFKKQYLDDLIVSIMTLQLDLNVLLITDKNDARKVVEFLDKSLDHKKQRGNLFIELRSRFSDVEITRKISKIAKEYSISTDYYPNCVKKKRMADFLYNIHERSSKQERAQLSHDVMYGKNKLDHLDIIRALTMWEKRDQYAGIAFGRMYGLETAELCRVNPDYESISKWDEERIKTKIVEMELALKSEEYIGEFQMDENYTIYLIDDLEKLRTAMKKLFENDKVAFDIEANYVCQSPTSISSASLLQLAFKDCVLIVDIHTLTQNVSDENLKVFFEMFLGTAITRVAFDIKSDLEFLRNTFTWMPEYLGRIQPEFHCVHRFANIVMNTDAYKEYFPEITKPSLREVADKWLKNELSKDERQGNWLRRPLSKEQMLYAAKDARQTLDAYYFVQKVLYSRELGNDMGKLIVTPRMFDRKKNLANQGRKEPADEILKNVEEKVKDMRLTLHNFEKPENITIVVDFVFLDCVAHLRRFGYKTYDQRDVKDGGQLHRPQVIQLLLDFLLARIADGTITYCYLLTTEYQVGHFKSKDKNFADLKIICCDEKETESSIIGAVMYETNSVVDIKEIPNRCSKCGESKTAFDFSADAFRAIFIHYAKKKGFFIELKCVDNSDELLQKLVGESVVKYEDQWMTYEIKDKCSAKFYLGDKISAQINYVNENGELVEKEDKYRCNSRLFQKLRNEAHVRFCVACSDFF